MNVSANVENSEVPAPGSTRNSFIYFQIRNKDISRELPYLDMHSQREAIP